ncbi:MAG: CDP-glucose 4,6-dehydratase [Candidatus Omnitrophica bacterium]|nr:CDP-glucose 4,6-dehydratase [Candidatus Omnitrophota bacterium]
MFGGVYKNRRVMVTGHTGFKGSWLCLWLLKLGAKVAGYSIDVPTSPSNFEILGLKDRIKHVNGDIGDIGSLRKAIRDFSPDIIFHLAAQSLARYSYDVPLETFHTNMGGTVNLLECLRSSGSVKAAVIVTSDKCYQNFELERGYREDDVLGGEDPYSSSKACAELATRTYMKAFFTGGDSIRIATARAGNVIGGGDWAKDRVIPDCVRAFSAGKKMIVRNPDATRPWQHVLEPLGGYLLLGEHLLRGRGKISGEAFNFGPNSEIVKSVREVLKLFIRHWGGGSWKYKPLNDGKKESKLLRLCCDKALERLGWSAVLNFEESIDMTADWYKAYYGGYADMSDFSRSQIEQYIKKAIDNRASWAKRS